MASNFRKGFGSRAGKGTKMAKKYKPGNLAPASGQYAQVGKQGAATGHEVTVPKGKVLPPTQKPGQSYVLADPTKNASGKKS
jgi:hypothetical protein